MYIFRGKVKTLEVNYDPKNSDSYIYKITFDYVDIVTIAKEKCGVSYQINDGVVKKSGEILENDVPFKIADNNKIIFDFISQHSREVLEVTYHNSNKEITGVKLSYE
jgi:hypothetical protein